MDCGAFAVANAFTLANDRNPLDTSYDQPALRPHLEKNFEEGRITPFPTSKIVVSAHKVPLEALLHQDLLYM